jgi:hypothetical protein
MSKYQTMKSYRESGGEDYTFPSRLKLELNVKFNVV